MQISLGYPSVQGRLHTRYAPVRRSQGSKLPLPLDLHVLGLPLAFILSQDQTLHRIFLILSINYLAYSSTRKILLSLYMLSIQYVYERVFFFNPLKASALSRQPFS